MIRHDSISQMLIVIGVMITLYLATYQLTSVILFPVILLFSGVMLQFYIERKIEYVDHMTEPSTIKNVAFYTIIAFFGIALTGYVVANLPLELTGFDALLFAILMAIAEEPFFRGFITNFLLLKLRNPALAIILSGFIFGIYHLARYGGDLSALFYVSFGGMILNWVGFRSGRLSPCMLAHIINNVIATIGEIV